MTIRNQRILGIAIVCVLIFGCLPGAAYVAGWLSRVRVTVTKVPVIDELGWIENLAMSKDVAMIEEALITHPGLALVTGRDGHTGLHVAAYADCGPCIEALVRHSANIDKVSTGERWPRLEMSGAPLHVAIRHGSWDAVETLLRLGAREDLADPSGITAREMLEQAKASGAK